VGGILQLIEPFEKDGTLVKRDRTEIERDIASYTVIEHDGVIFGCAALYPYPEAKHGRNGRRHRLAQSQGTGDGEKLLKRIEQRARPGLDSIRADHAHHALVHQARLPAGGPDWLPEARKRKYNWDRKSQVLVKKL
jgi:amino-acid N-acetyltransferase